MKAIAKPRPEVNGDSKKNYRTREVYSAGIRLMRGHVIMHPDATLTAIKIIWCLPARFNFKRWQATGLYDAGGQPDGRGISQETIAKLCEVSPDSVARSMKLFERILGMRINPRRRNPVTHQFEGAESYFFPTPKEARATSATCGNGSDEVKALKDNANGNRDSEQKPEPLPQTHTATCGTNLPSNLIRKKDSPPTAGGGAQDSRGAQGTDGRTPETESTSGTQATPAPDPRLIDFQTRLAAAKSKFAKLEAEQAQGKPGDYDWEFGRLKSAIYIYEGQVSDLLHRADGRKALGKLDVFFRSGDGIDRAKAPGGAEKLRRAITIARSVGESAELFCGLLAEVDPQSTPLESERALYAIVRNIPNINNAGALAASLIKAHGGNVRKAREAVNAALKREPRSLNKYLWGIVQGETAKIEKQKQRVIP